MTTAFCKRAAISQQLTKCLTEIFFDRALAKAQELDEYLERTGKTLGSLHGLPVSIKDRFDIEGYDTTVGMFSSLFYLFPVRGADVDNCIGWVGLVGKPAQKSSSIAQMLESMGAVLYVKTNVPQSLMVCTSPYMSMQMLMRIRCPTHTITSSASQSTHLTPSSSLAVVPEAKQPSSEFAAVSWVLARILEVPLEFRPLYKASILSVQRLVEYRGIVHCKITFVHPTNDIH